MIGFQHGYRAHGKLPWLAVEKPWSALARPFLSFMTQTGVDRLLCLFRGSISGTASRQLSVGSICNVAHKSIRHLVQTVQNILNASSIQQESVQTASVPTDIQNLTHDESMKYTTKDREV